MLLLMMILCYR